MFKIEKTEYEVAAELAEPALPDPEIQEPEPRPFKKAQAGPFRAPRGSGGALKWLGHKARQFWTLRTHGCYTAW